MPRHLDPQTLPRPTGLTSQGVLVGAPFKRLLTSPQTGAHPDGSFAEGFPAQLELAFDNALKLLAAAGLEPRDIVRLGVATTVPGSADLCTRTRDRKIAPARPAWAYREVSGFAQAACLVELELEAVREG